MKIMRIAGWMAGGLVMLLVLTVAAVTLFVDPNDYKDDIERLVEQQTGREFTLEGDLNLSVFPWLAIEFGPARLSDAPGFGEEPFMALRQARLSVRFWPLLKGAVEVGNVRLEGVAVRLVTDAEGRENWADLADNAGEKAAGETANERARQEMPTVAGLEIRDATVVLEDRRDDSMLSVSEFNLETGRLASGEPFTVESGFLLSLSPELAVRMVMTATVTADLESNVHELARPSLEAVVTGAGYPSAGLPFKVQAESARLDVGQEQYSLSALELEGVWKGEGQPDAGVPVQVRATGLQADLAAQTLALDGLQLDAAGAKVTGKLAGTEVLDAPRLSGQIELAPVSVREWLPRLGIEVPVTRDADVLQSLTLTAQVAATAESLDFQDLVLKLDDTTAKGSFGIADFEAQALRFDLDVDRIDADRYLAPEAPADAGAASSEPVEIPVETLRQLNARGTLDIGEAVFAGIRFTGLKLGVTARDGDVRFAPVEASAYGGRFSGDIGIAAATDTPRITLQQSLSDVDFAPLFRDLFESNRVAGKGSFSAKLDARGGDTQALKKTLNGALDFGVRDGALEGADLWYEIRRARAVLRQQPVPARTGPERTPFKALSGTASVRNGVVDTRDLTMAMEYLRVGGTAAVDLPGNTVDSRLEVTVLKIPAEGSTDTADMQELVNARIPVRVTGSLDDMSVRPDVEGYLKNKVRERVEEEKEKVEEKLRETLQDRLRRALGR